jgi:shikimate dehydrogenase
MRKFGLIGYPLEHSFSSKYFSEKFRKEKINGCSYSNYPLTNIEQLTDLIDSDKEICGLNVTIPYKKEVISYLDHIDPEAEQVGAVNVLKIIRSAGMVQIRGYNSDIFGIRATLMPFKPEELQNALVLGTGGSSKAVCYVLKKLNVNYTLVSRTGKPGCITYSDINADLLKEIRLIVNTTPAGMYPDTEGKPDIRYELLTDRNILFDLVYNPEITSFLKAGEERGCKILTGLKMLFSQAEKSWEIWNDPQI